MDNIIKSLKDEVGGEITEKTKLPEGKIDKVFSIIGDVAKKEVAGQMIKGNKSDLMNLFSNKSNENGADILQGNLSTGIISGLMKKMGCHPTSPRQ